MPKQTKLALCSLEHSASLASFCFLEMKRGRCNCKIYHKGNRINDRCDKGRCHDRRIKTDFFSSHRKNCSYELCKDDSTASSYAYNK